MACLFRGRIIMDRSKAEAGQIVFELSDKNMRFRRIPIIVISALFLMGCGAGKNKKDKHPKGGFNLFSLQQDKDLGKQVSQEIAGKPDDFPILDPAQNVEAYQYINGVRDKILNTGKVKHKDDFVWEVYIIDNDTTLNAFCTPGGYIYFYTGIIKYLENEAQLAGVMGHEMGHADLRHSTRQMTKIFGVQILAAAALGDAQALAQITTGLLALTFSRAHEKEADHMSVEYLCGTSWPADGGAGFFEKIATEGGGRPPVFLSTHPSPENRIENYHQLAKEHGCTGSDEGQKRFEAFQKLF
jgi:beta-barrel assembly-enhancing protease